MVLPVKFWSKSQNSMAGVQLWLYATSSQLVYQLVPAWPEHKARNFFVTLTFQSSIEGSNGATSKTFGQKVEIQWLACSCGCTLLSSQLAYQLVPAPPEHKARNFFVTLTFQSSIEGSNGATSKNLVKKSKFNGWCAAVAVRYQQLASVLAGACMARA